MLVWKDVSSYSQNDKIRATNAVQAALGPVRLGAHRHIHHPGKWVMSLYGGWIECRGLKAEGLEDAKAEAVEILASEMRGILAALSH